MTPHPCAGMRLIGVGPSETEPFNVESRDLDEDLG